MHQNTKTNSFCVKSFPQALHTPTTKSRPWWLAACVIKYLSISASTPSSAVMHPLALPPNWDVQLWVNQNQTPWAPTRPAGQIWTRSTTASWPTWWQPWTWPATAWPRLTATGPGLRGPPALTELDSQTGRCRCRRGGAAWPDSPPSRPNVCPSQMLMWGRQKWYSDSTYYQWDPLLIQFSFCFLQDCVQLNQYKLNKEIGKVINQCCACEQAETEVMTKLFTTVFFTPQGSYGVVKLAYNEDSEQYYVSWTL